MNNIIISEKQLDTLVNGVKKNNMEVSNVKHQLYLIHTMAHEMWDKMGDDENIDEWMESKLKQCEDNLKTVVQSYFHKDKDGDFNNPDKLDYTDLIIGK